MITSNQFDNSKSSHFVGPGNVYRTQSGELVVVSYCWSVMSADCLQVHPELKTRVIAPDFLRHRCQLVGKNYRLK